MNWCMVTLATVDLQRCAILESMVKRFEDEKVAETLTSVHPKLTVNVDDSQEHVRESIVLRPAPIPLKTKEGCGKTSEGEEDFPQISRQC